MNRPDSHDPLVWHEPMPWMQPPPCDYELPGYETARRAHRRMIWRDRAQRWFWAGMKGAGWMLVGALATLALTREAAADTARLELGCLDNGPPTVIELLPTDEPGAVAAVVYENRRANDYCDDGTYHLSIDGLLVTVIFTWNGGPSGADHLTILPPLGYMANPPEITLPENSQAVAFIYPGVS